MSDPGGAAADAGRRPTAADDPPQASGPPRRAVLVGGLAWVALVDAVLWWIYYRPAPKQLFLDEWQYVWTAGAIQAGGPASTYLIWPPGQATVVAWAMRALGGLEPAILAIQLWQTALLGLSACLLADLGRRLTGSRAAGAAAGLLLVAHPGVLAFSQYLFAEVSHLALWLLALWLPLRWREGGAGRLAAAGAGAAWGAALLFKSLLGAAWPLWIPILRRSGPLRPVRAWLPALAVDLALFLGVGLAVTVPARLDNLERFGEAKIADASAFGLWIGLTDTRRSDAWQDRTGLELREYLDSSPSTAERREIYLERSRRRVAERGPWAVVRDKLGTQYFRLLSAKTNLITQLPGDLCRGHLPTYRDPPPSAVAFLTLASHGVQLLTLAAFAFGLALWRRWRHPLALAAGGLLAYQFAVYFVLHAVSRYAVQLWPILCLFAGWFLAALAARRHDPGEPAAAGLAVAGGLRWALGALLALLLAWFAFAGPYLDRMCS